MSEANVTQNPKSTFNPVALILWSLWILWGFGYHTLWLRLTTECEGVVTASRDIPPTRGLRYATQYTLVGPDGQGRTYVAGPTDASLPRSMPVGTRIKKERWRLSFERNGQRVDDFSIIFYCIILAVATASLLWGIRSWHQRNPYAALPESITR
jgi:hypothetical protein